MHPAQQREFTADGDSAPARHLVPVSFDQAEQLLGHEDVSAWLTIDREHLREF